MEAFSTILGFEASFSVTYKFNSNIFCIDDPSNQQKEEFLQEIEQMKLLGAHQNIVSLVGCCTLQEPKFLVIEYVPFGDLLHWLRRRRRKVRILLIAYLSNLVALQLFGSNAFILSLFLRHGDVGLNVIFRAN